MYMSMKALYLIRQIICLLGEVKWASVLTCPSSKSNDFFRLCFQSDEDLKLCHCTWECQGCECKPPEPCDSLCILCGISSGDESISQWKCTQSSIMWSHLDADLRSNMRSYLPVSTTPSLSGQLWHPDFASSSAKWTSLYLLQSLKD